MSSLVEEPAPGVRGADDLRAEFRVGRHLGVEPREDRLADVRPERAGEVPALHHQMRRSRRPGP